MTLLVAIGLTMTSPVSGSVSGAAAPYSSHWGGSFSVNASMVLLAAVLAFGRMTILVWVTITAAEVAGDLIVANRRAGLRHRALSPVF